MKRTNFSTSSRAQRGIFGCRTMPRAEIPRCARDDVGAVTKRIRFFFVCFCLVGIARANIEHDVNRFFDSIGYSVNASKDAAFKSQAAGFFGAGSLCLRNQSRVYQLVKLDLPSFKMGCNGIDLYTGGFSFIRHNKLVELGKQVMTNGGAYAVDVLLATTVPELKQVRDYLQTLEQRVNQATIHSCELAQNLVGGIYPKTAASQQKICKDVAANGEDGLVADYVKARMECASASFGAVMDKARNTPDQKNQVLINRNLVWSLLQTSALFSQDKTLSEMVMSLTGTLIIDKEGKVTSVPSLVGSKDLVHALVGGSDAPNTIQLWQCKDATPDCLEVQMGTVAFAKEHSLSERIRSIIESMNNKLKEDKAFTALEKNFLNLTHFPVLKFLTVLNSTHKTNALIEMEGYITSIAEELLQQYITGLLDEVQHATASAAWNEDLVKAILKRIRDAAEKIKANQKKMAQNLVEKLALIEQMVKIEKQLAATLVQ